ncbi:MAG: hemolysin III family protein [Nannocystaceae bacterium]|nr:hemolysin III family protein [Nannocystaceae bacterium]
MSDRPAGYDQRPSMRGVLHGWALIPFVIAGVWLVLAAPPTNRWPTLGYALSVPACMGTSALYHQVYWPPPWYQRMRKLDHAMIFVLIVGTWTPLCLIACRGRDIGMLFATLCAMAVIGFAITLFWTGAPKWLRTGTYLAVSWVGVLVIPHLYATMGALGVGLLGAGGMLYSVGALAYAFQWPNPSPRVFGYHEIFHAFVILAAATHFALIAAAVVG